MNAVIYSSERPNYVFKGKLHELIERFPSETAFIGCIGSDVDVLFLITNKTIVLADNPRRTWSLAACPVRVDRFVDVEIVVHESD